MSLFFLKTNQPSANLNRLPHLSVSVFFKHLYLRKLTWDSLLKILLVYSVFLAACFTACGKL